VNRFGPRESLIKRDNTVLSSLIAKLQISAVTGKWSSRKRLVRYPTYRDLAADMFKVQSS
jgi:hypothetical protein